MQDKKILLKVLFWNHEFLKTFFFNFLEIMGSPCTKYFRSNWQTITSPVVLCCGWNELEFMVNVWLFLGVRIHLV